MVQNTLLPRGQLFGKEVLAAYLDEKRGEPIPNEAARVEVLRDWVASTSPGAKKQKETSLEQAFNQDILGKVLGFALYPSPMATAWPKTPTWVTGIPGEPDVGLGRFFRNEEPSLTAVLELKPPGTDLDAPQPRASRMSPVEQAFEYGRTILGVAWVIVSDMRFIRLYSVDSATDYEVFDLAKASADDHHFRRLFFLLQRDWLLSEDAQSPVASLLDKSTSLQLSIRDSFYDAYYRIRTDLYAAIQQASRVLSTSPTQDELLQATQRLLDRMLFLYYCEDHPDQLIPRNTVKQVTEGARSLPGLSRTKVYGALKELFREVDKGSPPANEIHIAGYNGELFKEHPVIDHIDLPDDLHDHIYEVKGHAKNVWRVKGAWGLHIFDFWRQLNEHLLGHIFEESLSDLAAMKSGPPPSLAEKLEERKKHGIYYTTEILSDFLTEGALASLLSEEAGTGPSEADDHAEWWEARLERLGELRIIDLACGSGAFLVSAYRGLLAEYWRTRDTIAALSPGKPRAMQLDFVSELHAMTQAQLLRNCLYGSDLLPQAAEIAKLALWLRSARKTEQVADLGGNIVATDSLRIHDLLQRVQAAPESFELVVGNPPWGGDIEEETYRSACEILGLPPSPRWDSWELFLVLALYALREGGRIAFVLPDTLFSPEKERSRRVLLEHTRIEKLHNLGPEWFGRHVRMGTLVLQARKGPPPMTSDFAALLLTGPLRRQAIKGQVPLTQIEAQYFRAIPQERSAASPTAEVEVFRSRLDDEVIGKLDATSTPLAELCDRARGEEMSRTGLLWLCPSCMNATTPGRKRKSKYVPKACPSCGFELKPENVAVSGLVVPVTETTTGETVGFIDGEDIARRYVRAKPRSVLRLGVDGFSYKPAALYDSPKILIRQAGVGLLATYDETGARCPQSVYLYRLKPAAERQGYTHEFILAALLSRTMTYYVFKRFSEVDPARAHAKVTHERLKNMPIPKLSSRDANKLVDRIVSNAKDLLSDKAPIGEQQDLDIEADLRSLWKLSPGDGAYVNSEFSLLPQGQVIRDLFPKGAPKRPVIPQPQS